MRFMIDDEIVEINFDIYEKILFEVYDNSSPKLGNLLEQKIGLELLGSDYEDEGFPILKFKIVDKDQWFLARIKFGI